MATDLDISKYTCVYKNSFAASQSGKAALKKESICSEKRSSHLPVILDGNQRAMMAEEILPRLVTCYGLLVILEKWAEKK